ncbi:MAG: transitional endoplasmic reticulum ATPase [Verrucomicrobiales bacterium]|jgi:transitional endoplasmic reticulum ATPase
MADSQSLREALTHSPDNVPLLLVYAAACLDEWSIGDARESYERAIAIDPSNKNAKLGLARSLYLDGKVSEAAVRIEKLVEEHPDFAAAFAFLSRVYLSEDNKAQAIPAYRKAVSLSKEAVDESLARELGISASPDGDSKGGRAKKAAGASSTGWQESDVDPFGNSSTWEGDPGDPDSLDDEDDLDEEAFFFGGEEDERAALESLAEISRPDLKFDDVGGMDALKEQIRMKILYPLEKPELFKAYGKKVGGGVLLYGPPGCGKTLISKATAGEINASFFSIGLHDILDMWIGSSEKNLHQIFEMARRNAPAVLFFDEVDALAADRKDLRQSAGRTVINQFLSELDSGDNANDGVLILGATNAPWHIDGAFRRPGRFDRTIFVPPPDDEARVAILEVLSRGKPVDKLDYKTLAKKTQHFSGADLKAVFDVATERALESAMKDGRIVPLTTKLLISAAKEVKPSAKGWFDSAKNYALYANQGGFYDDVLDFLGIKK